ncbi:MAG: GPR endopeptidase [Bacillales bacterium]|nr:GPR endopeptidase [Bacillales bacterium]
MKKEKNKSLKFDIADEIFTHYYEDDIILKKILDKRMIKIKEVNVKKEDNPFRIKKGIYTTISYTDLSNDNVYKKVEKYLSQYIEDFIKKLTKKDKPFILIVGVGNEDYSPDSLGPKVIKGINPTSHLDEEYFDKKVACIIPGVMGITGLESSKIVQGIISQYDIDLIITIDSLSTTSISRLYHVIQITNTGMAPGSGVNNTRKEISQKELKIPTISLGIATVISLEAIVSEIEDLSKKTIKRKKLNYPDIILTTKEIEAKIDILASLIADSLNKALNPKISS